MKVDYATHDHAYRSRKLNGFHGWDSDEVTEDSIAKINKLLLTNDVPHQGKLLDIGCGAGNLSFFLEKKGYEVTGIDVSEVAIAWAKEKVAGTASKVHFAVMNAAEVLAFTEQFDLVVDNHCLHCIIGEDRTTYLNNIYQSLKQKGFYLLSSMCANEPKKSLHPNYDHRSGCIEKNGIATRFIGTPGSIIGEIVNAGFRIAFSETVIEEGSDELLLVAQKPLTPNSLR